MAQKRLRTSFSAASERRLVRVKLRPGQRFLQSVSFPWLSLPAHRARMWLRGRDVKAVPDTDWLRGSEQMVLTDSHLYALCVKSGRHRVGALSLLQWHADEGNAEPKNRLLSATEAQGKGAFSFQANLLDFNGI